MYHKHHTKGIVLRGLEEGVDERRIQLLTESFGLLWVRVQAARTLASRLRSGVQDFAYGDFSLVHGKTGWRLVGVRAIKNVYESIKASKVKTVALGNIASLVRRLAAPEESDPATYKTCESFFLNLETTDPDELRALETLTVLRVLHHLGYVGKKEEYSAYLSTEDVGQEILKSFNLHIKQMTEIVNESLRATQIIT